jgi:hypothetical protein
MCASSSAQQQQSLHLSADQHFRELPRKSQ